jgi:hypothetical protein
MPAPAALPCSAFCIALSVSEQSALLFGGEGAHDSRAKLPKQLHMACSIGLIALIVVIRSHTKPIAAKRRRSARAVWQDGFDLTISCVITAVASKSEERIIAANHSHWLSHAALNTAIGMPISGYVHLRIWRLFLLLLAFFMSPQGRC